MLTKRTTGVSSAGLGCLCLRLVIVAIERGHVEVFEPIAFEVAKALVFRGIGQLLNGRGELVRFDQYRFDVEAGAEPKIVESRQIGRIGYGHEQTGAAFQQRQGLVFPRLFFVKLVARDEIQVEGCQNRGEGARIPGRRW